MKLTVIVVLAAVLLAAAGVPLWNHFVTDAVLDRNGMENPDYTGSPDDFPMVDGNYTYVDNEALLDRIAGTWSSEDGRYVLTLENDCRVTLTLDGETVLDDHIQFTYLQPGYVRSTEFDLDSRTLKRGDETVFGEIESFYHETSDDAESGRIFLEIDHGTAGSETVEFKKL